MVKELIDKNLLVKTGDGTYTLKSEDEEELMHSNIGALKEAVGKFAIPSDIKNRKNRINKGFARRILLKKPLTI